MSKFRTPRYNREQITSWFEHLRFVQDELAKVRVNYETSLLIDSIIENYHERDHGITAQTLEDLTGQNRLTIRRRLKEFKKRGWIEECSAPPNERGVYYRPSERIIDEVGPAVERCVDDFLSKAKSTRSN